MTASTVTNVNVDPAEIDKFSAQASRWWDPDREFKPLHAINPLRLDWILSYTGSLAGKQVLDVGCGGGILSESLAQSGADVTGIDLAERGGIFFELLCERFHQLAAVSASSGRPRPTPAPIAPPRLRRSISPGAWRWRAR